MRRRQIYNLLLCITAAIVTDALSAQVDLVSKMATNERNAREQRSLYSYSSKERSPRTGGRLWGEMAVETKDGVLRRVIDIDGQPLTDLQKAAEDQRIRKILKDPDAFRKLSKAQQDDETHAIKLLALLPKAFFLTPDGQDNGCTRIAFRPNPTFVPSSYEERVMTVMAGTVSVKEPEDRLCKVEAKITQPLQFGFGILGKLNGGGHVELTRRQVNDNSWKTSEMHVHVDGRILLLKSLSREQDTVRRNIQIIDQPLTLDRAAQLLHH